ncbi:MAG: primosomal protein N' [Planctomycetes bacterium RBG_16_43_13]|nr:MAG: primosomal protein N' [Planctomycetes bacterium RBG_16_43_13]
MNKQYAEIVFDIPIDRKFHYIVPETFRPAIDVGKRVLAPFGKTDRIGYCVGFASEPDAEMVSRLKEIKEVIDAEPIVDEKILALTRWMADYYLCSWGEALNSVVPPAVKKKPPAKRRKADYTPQEADAVITEEKKLITPTPEQLKALSIADDAIAQGNHKTILLYGVTGSGKTEVYLRAIEKVVQNGKQAIVLVPEISLTPQTVSRFKARFPRTAVLHSYLTERERAYWWKEIKDNKIDVIVGARSAIFAPVRSLGMVVVDEEHENTYKQESTPRYHIRDLAVKRAEIENAVVILGTATPSLEAYYSAETDVYMMSKLPDRIEKRPMPKIEVIDMVSEMAEVKRYPVISRQLKKLIGEAVGRKEQVILFLNRRGFATYINCRRCGWVMRCSQCDVALNHHKQSNMALCHHCNIKSSIPTTCPECSVGTVREFGVGTERVEEEIATAFPDVRISRMDSDSMIKKKDYESAISKLWHSEVDVLVGTQMIAKGLDVPNVTLVGVVSADTPFHIPDFRSAERTFQLITQVAGRAGRGPKGGRVVVQTFNPDHYAITAAVKYDYEGFAKKELEMRKEFGYPPFTHLVRILLQGRDEKIVRENTERMVEILKGRLGEETPQSAVDIPYSPFPIPHLSILSAPAPLYRIRNRYRMQILIKTSDLATVQRELKQIFSRRPVAGSIQLTVDVDPVSMM